MCAWIAASSDRVGASALAAAGGGPWRRRLRARMSDAVSGERAPPSRNNGWSATALWPEAASFTTGTPVWTRRRSARSPPSRRWPLLSPKATTPVAPCERWSCATWRYTANSPAPSRATSPGDHSTLRMTAMPAVDAGGAAAPAVFDRTKLSRSSRVATPSGMPTISSPNAEALTREVYENNSPTRCIAVKTSRSCCPRSGYATKGASQKRNAPGS